MTAFSRQVLSTLLHPDTTLSPSGPNPWPSFQQLHSLPTRSPLQTPEAPTNPLPDPASLRDATGAMLAGGQSRRMGQDKALMTIAMPGLGETTVGQVVLNSLASVCREVIQIGGQPPPSDAHAHHPDAFPDGGALAGVYTALHRATHDYVFVAGCDMPFLDPRAIAAMLDLATGYDVTLPLVDGRAQTLHAVYRTACTAPALRALESGRWRIVAFFSEVSVRELSPSEFAAIDPSGRSTRNVNTPEEFARAAADLRSTN